MLTEGSTLIIFYGAGGVGKTALLKKIEYEIKHLDELTRKKCHYITYDFSLGTDLREVLKTLKIQLSDYGCEFPFFDIGDYYYSLKIGQDISPPKAKSMMENIPWVRKIKNSVIAVEKTMGTASPFLNVARKFFETTDQILETIPITKMVSTCFSVADIILMEYMKRTKPSDEDHKQMRNQLNAISQEKNPFALYEFLPALFAMDVADWITATKNNLVVILDNYESLIGATSFATAEQSKRDIWLRELISIIPNTLWTIAGRNRLNWNDELADELEQHLITALSADYSDKFFQHVGVVDKNLRDELVKLTGGYPVFLDLCADVYCEYKRQHNDEPKIAEFGQKREEVIGRILRYLNAAGDDTAKDMLEFLCILGVWTDELAVDIGGVALKNFSRNTYKRVKNFSFIGAENFKSEDFNLKVFKFDRTIKNLLITTCDEKFILDVKKVADDYFKKFFEGKKFFDVKEIFYLKLWAKLIIRFTDDADKLLNQYKNFLKDKVLILINSANFDAAEEILKMFMNKLENLDAANTTAYTDFEMDCGWLRRIQGKYPDAYNITNSAYEKRKNLLGDEDLETVKAMHKLAISLNDLGQHDKALELREKIFELRKKILGAENPDTIIAMNNLAISLSNNGRCDDALTLQEQALTLSQKVLGDEHPDTIIAMNNLANRLSELERYDDALTLQEQALTLCKKTFGDKHPNTLTAMDNLANRLINLERYDDALTLQEQALTLCKEILGDEHPDTLIAMNNLAILFAVIGRYDEAVELQKKVLSLNQKILGDKHPNTLNAKNNLEWILATLGQHNEN